MTTQNCSTTMFMVATILFTAVVDVTTAQSMNMKCVLQHCAKEFAAASVDPIFLENTACELGCNKIYKTDPTPDKLHYQNCTTKCAMTYQSVAGEAFLGCVMTFNCISFPSIPGVCPNPTIKPGTSLATLQGEWWQHRGYNALWDCYPCQHIHAMTTVNDSAWCAKTVSPKGTVQAPCWGYTYSYDLYLTNGSTQYFQQTWQLPSTTPAGERIDIYYNYLGSWHNESWFIIDATDRYVLLVDCSYMMSWVNVGSIVWVRPNITLTTAETTAITNVYKETLGWNFSSFCVDRHGSAHCDGPKLLQANV
eukprot:m.264390 g.264390  ORF g.264390 m.264390 type:complete len:307 (-) comp55892_c0_seq1:193-1113(-)